MIRLWPAIFCVLTLMIGGSADARKVALIIGNSAYEHTTSLANPVNDAKLIAASADEAGFDDVTVALDLPVHEFQQTLRDFRDKANGAEVAMVYYAGHGIEGKGKNWLIPVDAELNSALDLPYEALELERAMDALSGAQIRMVVLDACRNNPFARTWSSATRAVNRGLIGVEADDVLVIYAAAPGQTALDGDGTHSPFASSFAERLPQPGLPVQLLGGMVRDDVLSETGGAQRPFVSASITGTPVYLVEAEAAVVPVKVSAIAALDESALDVLAWEGALTANTVAAFRTYLNDFPAGQFAVLASDNIASLTGNGGANSGKPAGLIDGFLPYRHDKPEQQALPIDGIWTISTIRKRIRIGKGRAYALDGWTHALFLKIQPEMVVLADLQREGPGQYRANDLPLAAEAAMALRSNGTIDVRVSTFPIPVKYTLIRDTLDDAEAMVAEQRLITAEK